MSQPLVFHALAACLLAIPVVSANNDAQKPVRPAQTTEALPSDLPPRMRHKLEQMTPEQRRKALKGWENYKKLSPEARHRLDLNYKSFRQMTPEERAQTQKRFNQFESLTPEQKRKVIENWKRWQTMSADEREKLRQKKRAQAPDNPGDSPRARTNGVTRAVPAAAGSER
jgi:hypothetical protein